MQKNLFNYQTYILRFWQEQDATQNKQQWRFTLLDSTKGHRYGFSSIDDLIAFIQSQMNEK
jgi:hypothetical protein